MPPTVELHDDDFGIDLDAPPGFRSEHDKHQFTLMFSVTVGIVFVLQMILPQIVMMIYMPSMPNMFGGMTMQIPHAGQAFRWQHELWVPVERVTPGRPPQTVLRVLNADGTWDEKREFALTVAGERYVPDGDKLWAVSAGSVSLLQNRQTTNLYQRRRLNDPKTAFVRDGELCALDRQVDGGVHLLAYREGEWSKLGSFQTPNMTQPPGTATTIPPAGAGGLPGPPAGAWGSGAIQLIDDDGHLRVIFGPAHASGMVNPLLGGTPLWSASLADLLDHSASDVATDPDAPVLADHAENVDPERPESRWTDLGTVTAQNWRITVIDGRPAIIQWSAVPFQSDVAAHWLDELHQPPFAATKTVVLEQLGVAADDTTVTLVADTFPPGGCRLISVTQQGFGAAMSAGGGLLGMFGGSMMGLVKLQIIASAAPILLTLVLLIVGHVLMARYRDARYGFGKDVVRLGSLLSRSCARVIDTIIFAVPMWATIIWAALVFGFEPEKWFDAFMADWKRGVTVVLMGVLGVMAYGLFTVVLLGTLEGWCGWTPGKLLCGLRVCRTNLRKCGALRGIVRQILLMIDGLFNYLVGIALIAFLPKCQRLGDLAMDTIVVEASSLPRENLVIVES